MIGNCELLGRSTALSSTSFYMLNTTNVEDQISGLDYYLCTKPIHSRSFQLEDDRWISGLLARALAQKKKKKKKRWIIKIKIFHDVHKITRSYFYQLHCSVLCFVFCTHVIYSCENETSWIYKMLVMQFELDSNKIAI